jgi:hypothetical protein
VATGRQLIVAVRYVAVDVELEPVEGVIVANVVGHAASILIIWRSVK